MSIEIANESGVEVDETALLAVARHALTAQRVNPMAELSLLIVDETAMAELNQRWMDKPGPTDVLAFPMDELDPGSGPGQPPGRAEEPALLGDVVLCPQVAAGQAAGAGHSTLAELEMLTVHGVLHLLGWDHAEPETEREMFAEQDRILRAYRAVDATGPALAPAAGPAPTPTRTDPD